MAQEVQLFQKENLGMVRILGDKEKPLFCLKDVCEILGITNNSDVKVSIIKEFGDDLDLIYPITDSLGRQQKATFITEPQLYFILMRSDKPKAKPFRQWVMDELIPKIKQNNSLQIINNKETVGNYFSFNNLPISIINRDGEPWFVAKEVCAVLEHTNHRAAIQNLDEDEKGVSKVYTLGGEQEVSIISESGLYTLIIRSNKPQAKVFRKWVTSVVLPAIRKTGSYSVSNISDRVIAIEEQKMQLERAKMLERLSDNYRGRCDGRYSQILDSYAIKELTGENILPLPERVEKYYTAHEVGDILGVSANRIGRIANLNHLKNEKYGKWFIDKAKHTNKEIEAFRYNQAGIDYIKRLMM